MAKHIHIHVGPRKVRDAGAYTVVIENRGGKDYRPKIVKDGVKIVWVSPKTFETFELAKAEGERQLKNATKDAADPARIEREIAQQQRLIDAAKKTGKEPPAVLVQRLNFLKEELEKAKAGTTDSIKPYVSSDRTGYIVVNSAEKDVRRFPKTDAGRAEAQRYLNDHWKELSATKDEAPVYYKGYRITNNSGAFYVQDDLARKVVGNSTDGYPSLSAAKAWCDAHPRTRDAQRTKAQINKELMEIENLLDKAKVSRDQAAIHMLEEQIRELVRERARAKDESANAAGKLSPSLEKQIGTEGSAHREEMPANVFLEPASRKYPVKEKEGGEWKWSRKLLLAAAREARMHGDELLAKRADEIRAREFGADI